jgi:hypothetical protein
MRKCGVMNEEEVSSIHHSAFRIHHYPERPP